MNSMANEFISVEQPLPRQNSLMDAQQYTHSTVDLSDELNETNNVNKVKESDTMSTNGYMLLFSSLSL